GKSKNVSSTSASFSRVVTAFGYFGPYSVVNRCTASRACARVSAYSASRRGTLHARLEALRDLVEDVAELVEPVALLARLRPDVAHCRPEAKRPVAHGDDRWAHGQAPPVEEDG